MESYTADIYCTLAAHEAAACLFSQPIQRATRFYNATNVIINSFKEELHRFTQTSVYWLWGVTECRNCGIKPSVALEGRVQSDVTQVILSWRLKISNQMAKV